MIFFSSLSSLLAPFSLLLSYVLVSSPSVASLLESLFTRNVWPCPLEELPSHVIKTVVMRTILSREKTYWRDNQKLEDNFCECFAELVSSVKNGRVEDVLWGVGIVLFGQN